MPSFRSIIRRGVLPALAIAFGLSGCFAPRPILDPSFPPACRVGPAQWRSADSVRVCQPGNGPLNEERLLGSWLYAMPIYVDCEDNVRPGFAGEWTRHDGGRRWSLRIRSGLAFRWGVELTAAEVASRWRSRVAVLDAGVDSVVATGNLVDVYFRRTYSDIPRVMAGNAFGLRLQRRPAISIRPSDTRGDLRDVLEDDVDIMITFDSDVVDYGRRHEHFTVAELPYDRVYVLLCRSRIDATVVGNDLPGAATWLRESLAADAVRTSARPAGEDLWWEDVDGCDPPSQTVPWRLAPPSPMASGSMQIVYESSDPIARGIVERLVALASAGNAEIEAALPGLNPDVQAIGRRRLDFDGAFAYVVALPLAVADPCYERLRLVERVHWLLPAEDHLERAIVPLVEARPYAIFRDGAPALSVDRFGNTRVAR